MSFADLSLRPEVLRAITEMGFTEPSPIQAQAIPQMLGRSVDFLGLAGTGTGKTAAFSIPLLERIDLKSRSVQALILCPTRELAQQVAGQISLLGKYLRVRVATVYGGAPYGEQVRALRSGAQIVVGTPGRVIDHLERETLVLDDVRTLILDEADEMFSMGFKEEIDKVVASLSDCNTWLFSATMSPEVRRIVGSALKDPVTVQVSRPNTLATGVEQYYYRVNEGDKPALVCKLIEAADEFYGLIFCQTKALVADLTRFMLDRGYKVDCLHGDMDQNSRERTMQAFRDRKISVLICTDVAARGLDVKDVTHVMNYSLPRELDSYVHRIGRTARSGKTGTVMNLLTFSHRHLLGRIEQHTRVQMKEGMIPTKREIAARKVARMLPKFTAQPLASRVLDVMGEEFKTALASMTPEEVASHFIVMMMPDIFAGEEGGRPGRAARTAAAPRAERPAAAARAERAPRAEAALSVREERLAARAAASAAPTAVVSEATAADDVAAHVAPAASAVEAAPTAAISAASESSETSEAALDNVNPAVNVAAEQTNVNPAVNVVASEPSTARAVDMFGDEVVEKKKKVSTLDQPPRTRKKPLLDEDEIVSMLEEPATFGVVKRDARYEGDERPRRGSRDGGFPRSQSQFRSGPRESMRSDRGGRFDDSPRANRFERAPRPSRPDSQYGSRPMSRPGFSSRPDSASRPDVGSRADGGARTATRPAASTRPAVRAQRPAAPMNLGKPPKHEAGPARTARQGETGGMNRRARRALQFGRSLDETN